MSKGDSRRPSTVASREYDIRWELAFGRIHPRVRACLIEELLDDYGVDWEGLITSDNSWSGEIYGSEVAGSPRLAQKRPPGRENGAPQETPKRAPPSPQCPI